MRWQIRCLLDGFKGLVPFHRALRRLKRRIIPYRGNPAYNDFTLQQGLQLVGWLRNAGCRIQGAVVLEVGSGWEPILPLLFSLAGAGKVYLTDANRLLSAETVWSSVEFMARTVDRWAAGLELEPAEARRLLSGARSGMTLAELLAYFRMSYLAPCDCREVPLPAASVDILFSRAVLEHIPPAVIQGILTESARLLRPEGVVFHAVDNSDHFEHQDKSISRINFLRYEEWLWRLTYIDDLHYQNRLRHRQYVTMLEQAGFALLRQEAEVDPRALKALPAMRLARRFEGMDHQDLATITSYLLARPAPAAQASRRQAQAGG